MGEGESPCISFRDRPLREHEQRGIDALFSSTVPIVSLGLPGEIRWLLPVLKRPMPSLHELSLWHRSWPEENSWPPTLDGEWMSRWNLRTFAVSACRLTASAVGAVASWRELRVLSVHGVPTNKATALALIHEPNLAPLESLTLRSIGVDDDVISGVLGSASTRSVQRLDLSKNELRVVVATIDAGFAA